MNEWEHAFTEDRKPDPARSAVAPPYPLRPLLRIIAFCAALATIDGVIAGAFLSWHFGGAAGLLGFIAATMMMIVAAIVVIRKMEE